MLEPCWRHFSLLGASWAHFERLAAFVVALGRFFDLPEPFGLEFWRFWGGLGSIFGGFGEVLEVQNIDFSRFWRATKAALRKCSDPYKTSTGVVFCRDQHIRAQCQNRLKFVPDAVRAGRCVQISYECPCEAIRSASKASAERPGVPREGPGRPLGRLLGALGRPWALLGRVLDALQSLLASPGRLFGRILAPGEAPGSILKPSGCIQKAILAFLEVHFGGIRTLFWACLLLRIGLANIMLSLLQ